MRLDGVTTPGDGHQGEDMEPWEVTLGLGHHSPGSPGAELAPHTQPVIIPGPGTSRTVFGG